jgi:hypothetical protein
MGILAHAHGPEARDTKNMGKDAHATLKLETPNPKLET